MISVRNRTRRLAALALVGSIVVGLALAASPAGAQYGGFGRGGMSRGGPFGNFATGAPEELREYPVKVETVGGAVTGHLRIARIHLACDLGNYAILFSKVKEVRFTQPAQIEQVMMGPAGVSLPAVVVTRSGEEIRGNAVLQDWFVQTDLGTLTIDPMKLKSLTVTGEPLPPTSKPAPAKAEATPKK